MICIVLAGGYGKRLWPLTRDTAKPLLPIGDRVVLDYVMDKVLELDELDKIIISTNLRFEKDFKKWMRKYCGVPLELSVEPSRKEEEKPGAVRALYLLASKFSDDCLVIAGDNIFTFSLKVLVEEYKRLRAPLIALYDVGSLELAKNYGAVEVDSELRIIGFEEKPANPKSTLVSTGIYVYPRKVIPMMKSYLEEGGGADRLGEFIEWLHKRIPVYGYIVQGEWWDIGTMETYREVLRRIGENPCHT